jgi:transposase
MADTPKRRPRRQFTDEFKASAVRLVLDEGKTVGAAARDLDLTETALREWVRRAQADRSKGRTGLTTAEREELARLRKENRELRTERDILKNRSRTLWTSDVWTRNSSEYAWSPEAVAVCFLVSS